MIGRESGGISDIIRSDDPLFAEAEEGLAIALITVSQAKGSTPREAGVRMLVSGSRIAGTIGGGRLEWDAIAAARRMLADGADRMQLDIPLGPEIGQCCGGRVALVIERLDKPAADALRDEIARALARRPAVFVFGAGHVGRALALALAPLPFAVTLADSRTDAFDGFTAGAVTAILRDDLSALAENAPPQSAFVVMTHSHALDSLIAATVLSRGDFRYLGLIGSATKRALFLSAFRDIGIADDRIARLTCPIGGAGVRDKRPAVIAAMTAAEIAAAMLG
jgi:xanthine dehydrogenase accessory factor